jgi:D-lactate dehydrogenase
MKASREKHTKQKKELLMRIAFFDTKPYEKEAFDPYFEKWTAEVRYLEAKLEETTVSLAEGCDVACIFVNDTANQRVIEGLFSLGVRILALRCAGYNQVDLRAAWGKLRVVRVPAYSPHAVAEHTAALLLSSVRRIPRAYCRTKEFNFSLSGLVGFDLYGKTVGILGTGRTGKAFAHIAHGFGMKLICCDKNPDASLIRELGAKYVSFEEMLPECDVISLHCPLTRETWHLLDGEALARCKTGVHIINTSRGGLVDAAALVSAIKSRKVGGACLDVYEEEADFFFEDNSGRILEDDVLARLLSMPNVIVTSQQAFLTREALAEIAATTVANLKELQEKGTCIHEIIDPSGGECSSGNGT